MSSERLLLSLLALLVWGCTAREHAGTSLGAITPSMGFAGEDTAVQLEGTFTPRATERIGTGRVSIDMAFTGTVGAVSLAAVTWIDGHTLNAVLPAGLAPGLYDAVVVDAFGQAATLSGAFRVVEPTSALSGTVTAAPTRLSVGQSGAATFTLRNEGNHFASGVAPRLSQSGSGAASVDSPLPASATLAAGSLQTFSFPFLATRRGTVTFSATAIANLLDGGTTSSPAAGSEPVAIELPATLTAVFSAPPRVNEGQAFPLRLRVSNDGEAIARGIQSGPLSWAGSTGTSVSASSPEQIDLDGGDFGELLWTVTAGDAGSLTLRGIAHGTDGNAGWSVDSGVVSSAPILVERRSMLTTSLSATPPALPPAGTITVTMIAQNVGGGTANAVTPSALVLLGATPTLVSGPTPASVGLDAGALATFVWTFAAPDGGSINFSGFASAVDHNDGLPVTSGGGTSNTVLVQRPATLNGVFTAPSHVNEGQTFPVGLLATNAGEATALAVTPGILTRTGSTSATVASGPLPPVARLDGGASVTFGWLLTARDAGTFTLHESLAGTDNNDGHALSVSPIDSNAVIVDRRSRLVASLFATPPSVPAGGPFSLTLNVLNSGDSAADAVTPSAVTIGGSSVATLVSGPVPATAQVPGGMSAQFVWSFSAGDAGIAQFSASASGTDHNDSLPVNSLAADAGVAVAEVARILSPFDGGTNFSYVFKFNNLVYMGPTADGARLVRSNPDGTQVEWVTLGIARDVIGSSPTRNTSGSPNPYPAVFGSQGCSNTQSCGPDNEDLRGQFFSGFVGSNEWLGVAGGRSSFGLRFVYMTTDSSTAPAFSYVQLASFFSGPSIGLSAAHIFNGTYLGTPQVAGPAPLLVRLSTLPSYPGLNAGASDAVNLRVDTLSGLGDTGGGRVGMIDSIGDFNNRLYVFNYGGGVRSNGTAVPRSAQSNPTDWATCTPSASSYGAKTSVTIGTLPQVGLEPRDRAFPQMTVFNGQLFVARNTADSSAQIWGCAPASTGSATECDPGDWSLVARSTNDVDASTFEDSNNQAIAFLQATAKHLYVGFNNPTGVRVFRSRDGVLQPKLASDFVGTMNCAAGTATCAGVGGDGFGVTGASRPTRFFDGEAMTFAGSDYVFLAAGNGTSAPVIYRISDP